jgi:hypothetical protein
MHAVKLRLYTEKNAYTAMPYQIVEFERVLRELGDGRASVLLGNGFSIGCDPVFRYASLYEAARQLGLSQRAQCVFEHLGTNNFEGVLRALDEVDWIGGLYGLSAESSAAIRTDADVVKSTLVEAVAHSHLDHTGLVPQEKKSAALHFLRRFHNVFTTNYDLLLYWVVMAAEGRPPFQDGFRAEEDEPDEGPLVFSERLGDTPGMYFLHGALHLFLSGGALYKHSWRREGQRLTDLIRAGLAEKQYPLFVAEGAPDKKLEQIQRHGYLWYCLDKLSRIERPLVIYGHALGPSDQHLLDALAGNKKLSLVFVGIHGDPASPANQAIFDAAERLQAARARQQRRRKGKGLQVALFQSESAHVWG